MLIGIFSLMKEASPTFAKRLLAVALASLGIMLHEAFMFWSIPVLALVMMAERRHRLENGLLLLIPFIAFAVNCLMKGDLEVTHAINDSWNRVLDGHLLVFNKQNSIGALSWQTLEAARGHIGNNIGGHGKGFYGIVYWPFLYVSVYYFISFFFTAFKPSKAKYGADERAQMSSLFLIVSACLLPMFAFLSCDYGRLFQYAAMGSYIPFLIIGPQRLCGVTPKWVQRIVKKINRRMGSLLMPQKGVLALLLLLIGVAPFSFDIYGSIVQSPLGSLGQAAVQFLLRLRVLIS
ncbi:MAG: hypothetical protein NC102_09200 [Clostridium sp.]|nr:hypothetical protein [Clostridium sp.]